MVGQCYANQDYIDGNTTEIDKEKEPIENVDHAIVARRNEMANGSQ